MRRVRELPWHVAFLGILVAGNAALVLAGDAWPSSAQAVFVVTAFGFAMAVLLLGRERTRRSPRSRR